MEITYLGVILMPLGFIWLGFSERWLYRSSVFFVPFTASALVNFPSGFWLSPVQFMGSMWFLRCVFKYLTLSCKMRLTYWLMSAFFAVVAISIAMPILTDGDLYIHGTILLKETGPLHFSSRNITTPMYVLFGLLFAAFVSKRNTSQQLLQETLRVYVVSALFVSVWGILQFACNLIGMEYPYFIFNNSANEVAQGFREIIEGTARVTSVATEPSTMAQFLVPVLPVVVFAFLLKQPVLSKSLDVMTMAAIIFILLVSTSGTAYLGLILCVIATMIVFTYLRRAVFKVWFVCSAAILVVVASYITIPFVNEALDLYLINKLASGSGMERLLTIKYAWSYFLQYPIFGIGWGSATTNDLIVALLVNTGIIGLATFTILIGYVVVRLIGAVSGSRLTHILREVTLAEGRALAILVSFLLSLALQESSGFSYGYAYFWMVLGLVIAAPSIFRDIISPIHVALVSRQPVAT